MTEPTELLRCPFCGSKATASVNKGESLWSHDVVDWTRVHCTNDDCNAQTEATCEGYEPSAIEVWNRRTPPAVAGEPYGWHYWNIAGISMFHTGRSNKLDADIAASKKHPDAHHVVPLYTAPQPTHAQAGAVPLTDEQINILKAKAVDAQPWERKPSWVHLFARAIERAHGIGIKGGQHGTDT